MHEEVTEGRQARTGDPSVTPSTGRGRREDGAVTAEAAAVIPVLVAVALGLVWLVALATAQVRVVDAAREAARVAARGESTGTAAAHGARVAPDGARVAIERSDEVVEVRVTAPVAGPGGLFRFLPEVRVDATSVAAREPG